MMMRNDGKIEISAGGVIMLAVATLVATGFVFLFGIYVGKGMTEERLAGEQRVVRLPAQEPSGEGADGEATQQSFWDRLNDEEEIPAARSAAEPSPTEAPVVVAPPPAETEAPRPTVVPTATARPTPPPRPTATPVAKAALQGTYQVQVQALSDRAAADRVARDLRSKGYETALSPAKVGSQTLYRVRVGPFATEDQARDAVARLKQQGFPGAFLAAGGE